SGLVGFPSRREATAVRRWKESFVEAPRTLCTAPMCPMRKLSLSLLLLHSTVACDGAREAQRGARAERLPGTPPSAPAPREASPEGSAFPGGERLQGEAPQLNEDDEPTP